MKSKSHKPKPHQLHHDVVAKHTGEPIAQPLRLFILRHERHQGVRRSACGSSDFQLQVFQSLLYVVHAEIIEQMFELIAHTFKAVCFPYLSFLLVKWLVNLLRQLVALCRESRCRLANVDVGMVYEELLCTEPVVGRVLHRLV